MLSLKSMDQTFKKQVYDYEMYLLAVKTRKNEDKLATQTNCCRIDTEQAG